jgi:subtilisin family serine protease
LEFEPDLNALVSIGITPVFAAGNFGPNSATDTSPGNNPDAFAFGDTDNGDNIVNDSSRGPTACGRAITTTFPTLVAPGVGINTTDLNNQYTMMSGTSFSAPHASGAIALLLSAFPRLSVASVETAFTMTAVDLGTVGPDNTFGYGRIDVLAAYNAIISNIIPSALPFKAWMLSARKP